MMCGRIKIIKSLRYRDEAINLGNVDTVLHPEDLEQKRALYFQIEKERKVRQFKNG